MWYRLFGIVAVTFALAYVTTPLREHPGVPGEYENSLIIAIHYVEYLADTDERFAHQAGELKRRLGSAPYVLAGFATSLPIQFPASALDQPLTENQMKGTLDSIDRIVERARASHVIVHITLGSGFFHGTNDLRLAAIRQDVRNAQWFADGWIGEPASLTSSAVVPMGVWITPSRYARLLRARMEEGVRLVGSHLAAQMAEYPKTLFTISGDGEVELNYERTISGGEHVVTGGPQMYADYSPFMIEEFRDWIEHSRYDGDLSPSTDDNRDGRTFNGDFKTAFTTWRLRYFESSGPIPYSSYLKMPEKLPASGTFFIEGGFDAPRVPSSGDPFWELWIHFREQVISNYVRDFASWVTTSPDPSGRFTVPASHFYSHQIPADFLFGEKEGLRLKSSASPARTAFISPVGSSGVTVFNTFDGRKHKKTGTPELYEQLAASGPNWGIFEFNLSVPVGSAKPGPNSYYYTEELRTLYEWRPHVIVPFAWTDIPSQKVMDIQNSTFEDALSRFIREVGDRPWVSKYRR